MASMTAPDLEAYVDAAAAIAEAALDAAGETCAELASSINDARPV
jgi:hypothetical protein